MYTERGAIVYQIFLGVHGLMTYPGGVISRFSTVTKPLNFSELIQQIAYYREIEEYLAKRSQSIHKFDKKWSIYDRV